MSHRTARTRLFAATTVALAALALTACEGGTSDSGAGHPAPSTPAAATPSTGTGGADDSASPAAPTGSDGSTRSGSSGGTHGSGGTHSGGSKGSGGAQVSAGSKGTGTSAGGGSAPDAAPPGKCSAATVRITATEMTRPINHLLLTATNTGKKTCLLPSYPPARFGEAQSVPPVAEDTKPQSLTGLAPGESGYAAVRLSAGDGSAAHGHTVHSLTVPFEDGSIATVSLPATGVYVDDSLTVTYWQAALDTVRDW
ncbi:DUF4232 domain-containing protein [Streptomyces sp. NPDC049915]|uniref:DUF4232 domain-containing protein n=1 Tax=Streptomyces sp. NPDC049915 TaxID=3155510 RepID=UPI00342BC85F